MSKLKAVDKTSRGLAFAMFEELEKLRSGESTPQQARAKAAVANTICAISRLELDFTRFVSSNSNDERRVKELPMG